MRRPWQIWGAFVACVVLVTLAVGWLSLRAWEADRAELQARLLSTREENVRLALWRIDSIVAPFIAQESVRPPSAFHNVPPHLNPPDFNPQQALNRPQLPERELLNPTPGSEHIQLYFQIDCDDRITSPQVWYSQFAEFSGTGSTSSDFGHGQLLDEMRQWMRPAELRSAVPTLETSGTTLSDQSWLAPPIQPTPENTSDDPPGKVESARMVQQTRSQSEFQARRKAASGNSTNSLRNFDLPPAGEEFQFTPLGPVVHAGELLLVRRARQGNDTYLQGCWLDWPGLRQQLQQEVEELLPGSRLELLPAGPADPSRTMASLPVRLVLEPGGPATRDEVESPVRQSLFLAWGALGLAALAVAALLGGVLALSERRASFVSAVTHELRTPLTTFRMYSEMLAEGMVPEGPQRVAYLRTLRLEADRLSHLVENVLAYARLERGGLGNRIAPTPAEQLVATATSRAAERAAQGGMEFVVLSWGDAQRSPGNRQVLVLADPSAVEQIVFNLVDNACKYASRGNVRRIEVTPAVESGGFVLRIRDYGPGIGASRQRRLFQAFSKSADEAAVSAPGVGLGLALSRRLARDMGGDLEHELLVSEGAQFRLTLRRLVGS